MVGGELAVGHSYLIGEGDMPREDPVSVGLLGADLAVENGRYRIKRIYTGENWNPELRAPLSAPGIQVSERRLPARSERSIAFPIYQLIQPV
jgi:tricorn protease